MLAEHRTIYREKELHKVTSDQHPNPVQSLLSYPIYERVISHNCFSVDNQTRRIETFSSAFVTAISGLVLRELEPYSEIKSTLAQLKCYLIQNYWTHWRVNFFDLSEHNFDLDTFICVNLFLLSEKMKWSNRKMLIDTIKNNKCHETGRYKTWFDRTDNKENNIDFFVNLNTYVFLNQLSYKDEGLCRYLITSVNEFLSHGSHYYRRIEFPLFLIFFYWRHQIVSKQDDVFSEIISTIQSNPSCKEIVNKMFHFYDQPTFLPNGEMVTYKFPQYFNSSSKSFHSPVLDTIINAYLFCQSHRSNETSRLSISTPI